MLEVLHRALVLLGGLAGGEGAEVAPLAGLWVLLACDSGLTFETMLKNVGSVSIDRAG